MNSEPRVICIAPAWNEARQVGKVVSEVPMPPVHEVVVVDDASSDDTAEAAREAGATVIRHDVNKGVGAAIRSGLEYARDKSYDIAVIVSGGGKTPPDQIPKLLAPILCGDADMAQGSRYTGGGACLNMPWHRAIGTRGYTFLFSVLVRRRVTDASSGFRAIRLSTLNDARFLLAQDWLDRYELEPYLLFQMLKLGYRVVELPVLIAYPERTASVPYTKMRLFVDWWRIFRPVLFLALGIKK